MLFSYYFDHDRTHVLNCGFDVQTLTLKENGTMEVNFIAYIEEKIENETKKREETKRTFSFAADNTEVDHDVDFIRTRYADQKKWVFEIKNNKSLDQTVTIGLISETANQNPLGLDIYHDTDLYHVELRANNLAQLEDSYVPPEIIQTIASSKFEKIGYPLGFSSNTGTYDATYQLMSMSDFEQLFSEPIPAQTKFKIDMDLAPTSMETVNENPVFLLELDQAGSLSLLPNGLKYNGSNQTQQLSFGREIHPEDFYQNGFQYMAHLSIEGDGVGTITLHYGGLTISSPYDTSQPISKMKFTGNQTKLDNLTAFYQK